MFGWFLQSMEGMKVSVVWDVVAQVGENVITFTFPPPATPQVWFTHAEYGSNAFLRNV
jgi:hypothetical protein